MVSGKNIKFEFNFYVLRKECQLQTVGFTGAQFKKFDSKEEAEKFIDDGIKNVKSKNIVSKRSKQSNFAGNDNESDDEEETSKKKKAKTNNSETEGE